jgi:PAS domain S-box-containing protein
MGVDAWEAEGAVFRVLVEGMADAVAVLDRDAVLQYANPAAEALFGYTLAERRGRDILDLLHPEDLDLVVGSLAEMANIEVPGAPLEVRARAADGSGSTSRSSPPTSWTTTAWAG